MGFPVKFIACGIVFNVVLALCAVAPLYIIKELAPPQVRGFDPSDSTIALSILPSTISSNLATWGSAFLTALVVLIVEVAIAIWRRRTLLQCRANHVESSQKIITDNHSTYALPCKTTPKQIWKDAALSIWLVWVILLTAYGIDGTVTNLGKTFVARPRPNFLHSCRPDYRVMNITACQRCGAADAPGPDWPLCPSCSFIPGDIALTKVCKVLAENRNPVDMWLSFPSGHASYSLTGGVFLAVYLHNRLRHSSLISQQLVALHPLIIFASLLFGIFSSLTRVSDHKHHLTDVLAGAALGSFIGFMTATTLALPVLQKIPEKCAANNCDNNKGKERKGMSPGSPISEDSTV